MKKKEFKNIGELGDYLRKYHEEHKDDDRELKAYATFSESNFDRPYSERQRTYAIWTESNGFFNGKISNAVYMDCLDGTDQGVRWDYYHWKTEKCWLLIRDEADRKEAQAEMANAIEKYNQDCWEETQAYGRVAGEEY